MRRSAIVTLMITTSSALAAPSVVPAGAALALSGDGDQPQRAVGDRWSDNVEVSTPTTRNASDLVLDAAAAGDFALAWSQDTDDDVVAVSGEIGSALSAPQVFEGDYDDPDVAIGGNGVAVLGWESAADRSTVYAASKAGDTDLFSSPESFVGDGHGASPATAENASVAVTDAGVGMLFYERDSYNPPSYSDIAEAVEGRILLDPASNTWNAGTDVHGAIKDPRSREVSVAADGSAFLGTNNFSVGPCWDVGVMLMRSDGTGSGGGDIAVGCNGGVYNGIYPSSARLPDSSVVMAYPHASDRGVYVVEFPAARAAGGDTNLESAEVRLDGPGETSGTRALVRTDAAGNAVVVWYDSNSTGEDNERSMLARFRPSGSSEWGAAEVISSGENYQGDFDFDVAPDGTGYLVYERTDTDSGNQEVVAVERPPGATASWTTPEVLSELQGTVASPQVAAADGGRAVAAWIGTGAQIVSYATIEPAPEPEDTTPPGLRLQAKKQSDVKRLTVRATCGEPCSLTLEASGKALLKGKGAPTRKLGWKAKPTTTSLRADRATSVALKVKGRKTKRQFAKALKRKRGKVVLQVVGSATDAAGNETSTKQRITLRR